MREEKAGILIRYANRKAKLRRQRGPDRSMIEIREQAGTFGVAEVRGISLDRASAHADSLRAALARSGVVCLRLERLLEEAELEAVARLFGSIKDPVGKTKDGGEIRYGSPLQIIDSGFVMTDEVREKFKDVAFGGLDDDRPGLFETFHCDDTYTERPACATVLHARALPQSGGGPTHFIDMRAAYEQLSPSMKSRIEALKVVYAYNNEEAFPPRRSARGPAEALVDVSHPLVRTHDVAGTRSLFIDLDRAKGIEGMPTQEGRRLLRALQDGAEANAPACQHAWSSFDVLVWDNASVQHKAGGDFKLGEPRLFWRHMIEGERPA